MAGAVVKVFHHSFFAMGTRLNLILPGLDSADGYEIAEAVEHLVLKLEKKLSRFDSDSLIGEINERAHTAPVSLDEEGLRIFSVCNDYHKKTVGAFDIALLPLTCLWREAAKGENGKEPAANLIETTLAQSGMDRLHLDPAERTVRLDTPEVKIDLGGFGKGYALGKVIPMLIEQGISRAFLSFGESSVSVIGGRSEEEAWKVGIEHLFREGESIHTFNLRDASLSTSGTGSTPQPREEARHGHVISPFTGYPVAGCRIMSVVSESPVEAEILSTALLVLEPERRADILKEWFKGQAIEFTFDKNLDFRCSWAFET